MCLEMAEHVEYLSEMIFGPNWIIFFVTEIMSEKGEREGQHKTFRHDL